MVTAMVIMLQKIICCYTTIGYHTTSDSFFFAVILNAIKFRISWSQSHPTILITTPGENSFENFVA